MSGFSAKMDSLSDKLKHKARLLDSDHLRALKKQIQTTYNPNHRHDEEHEKEIDRQNQAIRDSHRFNSFAPETKNAVVRSHVDGHDFFWAVSIMLEEAVSTIFILDWWLTPELYLRRPPALYPEYRLDRLLKRKAEQGVKIYIIVYKEVTQSMSMSSSHTKHALEDLHDNIAVMRHPDHLGGEVTLYWSHHEKMTIIDNTRASVGGLDLCFGRWDTHDHPLADVHPTSFHQTMFPGPDYNNARVLDFQNVDDYCSQSVDTSSVTRMPWHDTSLTLVGPAVIDLAQHFIERWNFVKHSKYKYKERYDWLGLPQPYEAPVDVFEDRQGDAESELDATKRAERRREHPHLQNWLDIGRSYAHPYHFQPSNAPRAEEHVPKGTCNVQVVRSSGDWSHGILVEDSIQRAYAQMIMEANHCIYMENQFFITNTESGKGPVQNLIGRALVQRILSAARSGTKFKVIIIIPEIPAFPGDLSAEGGLKAIMGAQYRSINRGGNSIMECIAAEGYDPMDYIRWYNLRGYDRINAPKSFIKSMEERSGVKFAEAQVALAKIWIGSDDVGNKGEDRVKIFAAADESGTVDQMEKGGEQQQGVAMPKTVEEAQAIIDKFEGAANRPDEHVPDNVCHHSQAGVLPLSEARWAATEEEERDAYVAELDYIHSKIMIVDDRRVICGSANLNDRSQCGDHDSEIAVVVEDMDMVKTTMDGKPYEAARFAKAWRQTLMKEHLGLLPAQGTHPFGETPKPEMLPSPHEHRDFLESEADQQVSDFLSDEFQNLWIGTAKRNREIFTDIFQTSPHDKATSWAKYRELNPKNIKTGHVANKDLSIQQIKESLSQIRGHLVEMPLQFLIEEKQLASMADLGSVNSVTLPLYL